MADFSVDKFTAKLSQGGALSSLFQCKLTAAKGTGSQINDFQFLCKGVSFPASTIEVATVTFMGRALNIPGNRAAQQLTTSIYNDEKMEIRNHLENWMESINSHASNKRSAGMKKLSGGGTGAGTTGSYTGSLEIVQLAKDDTGATKTYQFRDCWPSSTGEIALSWDTNDIQTYDVTWEYNYWTSAEGGAGTT